MRHIHNFNKIEQYNKCVGNKKELRAEINEVEFYYIIERFNLAKICNFKKTNKKAKHLAIKKQKNVLKHENKDITSVTEKLKEKERTSLMEFPF